MALTTLSQLKAFLNVTTTAQDTWLDALRLGAEQLVKTYCDQELESGTYTEYHDGNDQRVIVLRQRPVTGITSIHLDHDGNFGQGTDPFPAETLLVSGVDYALDRDGTYNSLPVSFSGVVQRVRTVWPRHSRFYLPGRLANEGGPSVGNIKVVYTAGYNPVPQDLQYAVTITAAYMKQTANFGGHPLKREQIGEYSYEIYRPYYQALGSIPEFASVRQILGRYRDCSIR